MSHKIDIQADEFGHQHPDVYGTQQEMTLFYDETNNIRKLRLRENRLNVQRHDNFVLGGIVLLPGQSMGDILELRKVLYIQPSAKEIKFNMIGEGDFLDVLGADKLTKFLTWLRDREIGIHYMNVNVLHWVILDIIESIVADDAFEDVLQFQHELKNELYYIAVRDLPSFLAIMQSYTFPDIPRERTGDFIREVRDFVAANWPTKPNEATKMLRDVLLRATSLNELAFLVDEEAGELIDGFDRFFLNRICTFKNARQVLDEEKEVQAALARFRFMNGQKEMDISFVDSVTVPGIQLSDVIVGLLGKYFSFIENTHCAELMRLRDDLTSTQKQNLETLGELISISDRISNDLLFRLTTMDGNWKSDAFLWGTDPLPHLMDR